MALVTLQTILQDAFPAYEALHPLPAHVRKAARTIMQCRTAALGGHVQACPDGHVSRTACNKRGVITGTLASHNGVSSWGRVKRTWE